MKTSSFIVTCAAWVALGFAAPTFAAGEGWSSDFSAAKKEAAAAGKDLLVDFTGSDWCGWCIKLNKEVFSHAPFKQGVKDTFVLVELDYPRDKSKLSEETIKQNEELGKLYQVRGYPTIMLADADGKPYATTGYQPGGPEAYVKHLDELRAKKSARDAALASAAKLDGVEKATALVAALAAMDLGDAMVTNFYGDVVAEIKSSDPEDKTGFAKETALKARIANLKLELGGHLQKKDQDGAIALLDRTLAEGGLPEADTQQIMVTRGMIFAEQKKYDEAINALREAKAFAPESESAKPVDDLIKRFEQAKLAERAGE